MQIHKNRNQPLIIQIHRTVLVATESEHQELPPRAAESRPLLLPACLAALIYYLNMKAKKTEIYENKIRKNCNLTKMEYP